MEFTVWAKYIRVSPRKLQLLVRSMSGMSPATAVDYLTLLNKSSALPLAKAIKSALSNAALKNVAKESLQIDQIHVLAGSAMKRFRAVSRGRAHEYKKRMSHIKIVLKETEKPKSEKSNIKMQNH